MKKTIGLALTFLLIVSMLAGCTSAPSSDAGTPAPAPESTAEPEATADTGEAVKLVFLGNETALLPKEFWNEIADKYMAAHPEVTIETIFQPAANITVRDYAKTLLATGQFPDVMVMPAPGEFVGTGALGSFEESELSIISPEYLSKIDGEIYVAPYKIQAGGVFYNKDIFAQYELSEPTTYAEFEAICQELLAEGVTPVMSGMKESWAQILTFIAITSADMNALDPNWPAERKAGSVTFSDSPEFVRAMEKYQTILNDYANADRLSMSYTQSLEAFYSGQGAMYIQGSWTQGDDMRLEHDFETGYFVFPGDKDNSIIPIWANEGLSYSSECKHPEVAKDFINFFLTDQEWMSYFLETEQLFSATVEDIPYEQSDLHKEVAAKLAASTPIENFYDAVGDNTWLPGVTQLFDKLSVTLGSDANASVTEAVEDLDNEYRKIEENLN